MNKDELINNLHLDNNISEKYNSKIEYDRSPKIEDEKYIKEMYEYADRNEFTSNVIFCGSGIAIIFVFILLILLNSPFMRPKMDVSTSNLVSKNTMNNPYIKTSINKLVETPNKIFEYLNIEKNRTSVLKKAVELNKGSQKGVTIYLLSEILRLNSVDIPTSTFNVNQLMECLTSMHWKKDNDFNQLEKGDICFTTDVPKKLGVPSHAYVFMGWVQDGKTDYAYVCDGQIEQYGTILHKRNISIPTTKNDKFKFFLRK